MCLELYSTDQPIQIPFEHETFRFLTPTSFRARYAFLVRNAGYRPIHRLSVIFPRPIYRLVKVGDPVVWEVNLAGLEDLMSRLPDLGQFFGVPTGGRMTARLPDPNNPVCDLPRLNGYWDPNNVTWSPPQGLTRRCVLLLQEHRFAAWEAVMREPIAPGDAHWFCWQVGVENAGDVLEDSLYGTLVFHEIASPIDVRRTLVESLQSALRDIHEYGPEGLSAEHEAAYRRIIFALGLNQERRVDIQYYELTVQTGDPQKQVLLHHTHQGDVRIRSGSPRVGRHLVWDAEILNEPVYEWKSGSILEPAHPWRNSGFSLRLMLGCKKPRARRSKTGHLPG